MIRYKVVDKYNRSIMAHGLPSKYVKKYKVGEVVKAVTNTVGLFCFKDEKYAKRAKAFYSSSCKIIKVKPIGRGKTPKNIPCCLSEIDNFYNKKSEFMWKEPPVPGTICYPSVMVLE